MRRAKEETGGIITAKDHVSILGQDTENEAPLIAIATAPESADVVVGEGMSPLVLMILHGPYETTDKEVVTIMASSLLEETGVVKRPALDGMIEMIVMITLTVIYEMGVAIRLDQIGDTPKGPVVDPIPQMGIQTTQAASRQ